MKFLFGLSLITILCCNAKASNCSIITRDFVEIHFGSHYYGQEVESVRAHIGSLINPGSLGESYWASVHDIELWRQEGEFVGTLDATTQSGVYFPNEGMLVQYFIELKSGESVVTREFKVPVRLGHDLTYPLYPGHYCTDGSRGRITLEEAMCAFGEDLKNFFQLNHQISKTQRMSIRQVDC